MYQFLDLLIEIAVESPIHYFPFIGICVSYTVLLICWKISICKGSIQGGNDVDFEENGFSCQNEDHLVNEEDVPEW